MGIEKKKRELAQAEKAYKEFNQLKYRTDSDTEQSGYESSGYDDTFFRRGYSNSSPFRPAFSSPNESSSELHASAALGSASRRQGASQQQQQVWSLSKSHSVRSLQQIVSKLYLKVYG